MGYIEVFFFTTIFYSLYVQFHPSMGGIWLRRDEKNNLRFVPSNLGNLMSAPLKNKYFWSYNFLIINYIFLILASFSCFYVINNYNYKNGKYL